MKTHISLSALGTERPPRAGRPSCLPEGRSLPWKAGRPGGCPGKCEKCEKCEKKAVFYNEKMRKIGFRAAKNAKNCISLSALDTKPRSGGVDQDRGHPGPGY